MKKNTEKENKSGIFSRAVRTVRESFYDLSVKLHRPQKSEKKITAKSSSRRAQIFCICMLVYPLLQWLIFYVYANFNSIMLAFQQYDTDTGKFVFLPVDNIFMNFKNVIHDLFDGELLGKYFKNGVIMHGVTTLVGYPVSLMFAYIIYKKTPLAETFKVLLYLPSILSSMVIAMFFKYFIERAVPAWASSLGFPNMPLLLMDSRYNFATILLYSVFFAMPGSIIINVSTMSRVPTELVEYGKLEGVSMFREFISLTLPLMYPLIEVQLLGVFVGFFTASGPLYALYAENASPSVTTFGYYMFTRIVGRNAGEVYYGYTSASNLLIGLISVPLVYGTKWIFDKFDPEVDF